jgi:hypothetical protein
MPKSRHRKAHKEKSRQYKGSLKNNSTKFQTVPEFRAGPAETILTSVPHHTMLPGSQYQLPSTEDQTLNLNPNPGFAL